MMPIGCVIADLRKLPSKSRFQSAKRAPQRASQSLSRTQRHQPVSAAVMNNPLGRQLSCAIFVFSRCTLLAAAGET